MYRFYVPQPYDRNEVEVEGDESTHMLRVLRLPVGAQVTLFDGDGAAAIAEIHEAKKRSVRLKICDRLPVETAHGKGITLITAVPKSDRFRWLVEKATELGVKRIVPVRTERSIVHPGDGKLQKMQSASIAACKQCGRNDLLTIDPLIDWAEALKNSSASSLFIADPGGRPLRETPMDFGSQRESMVAIGPEGGLTQQEIDLAQKQGAQLVSLGPTILRIETAALALAAWLRLSTTP